MSWNHKIDGRLQFRYHKDADRIYIDEFHDDDGPKQGWVSIANLSPEDFTEICKSWLDRMDDPDTDLSKNVEAMSQGGTIYDS